jgi:hypothetical protein
MSSERKTLKVIFFSHTLLTRMRRHISATMLGITCYVLPIPVIQQLLFRNQSNRQTQNCFI